MLSPPCEVSVDYISHWPVCECYAFRYSAVVLTPGQLGGKSGASSHGRSTPMMGLSSIMGLGYLGQIQTDEQVLVTVLTYLPKFSLNEDVLLPLVMVSCVDLSVVQVGGADFSLVPPVCLGRCQVPRV